MKRLRSNTTPGGVQITCCTVSAAALMLGVSQAATVGFNFQANYCAAPSYAGAVVTAPAFGIGTNGWESLTQMNTGYGCSVPCGFTTLSEVIDTTTASGGLNPLPRGALNITWGGYAANVSGFGGYDRPGPHYTFGGNGYNPGNEQVYWGFLRDGVNFGPIETNNCGGSAGDNTEPGYNIDITGLKSLFTNSFAVELIASSDSLWKLTNAFVIDATANTTQSVEYPSIPTPSDQGGTTFSGATFPRGIGGGLSTASGSFNTDHLKIVGNRAQHGSGYNFASTIAGFIITDKPVVTMSPNSVLASPADTVVLSASVVGVPPLAYQWRLNGRAIADTTTIIHTIVGATEAAAGAYDLVVSNAYGSATSGVAVVTVDRITPTPGRNFIVDSNPQNAEHDGLNWGASWQASSTDSLGTNRAGVMSFNASASNQIQVPTGLGFNSPAGTIMFWMRSSGVSDPAGNPAMLLDRRNGKGGAGMVLALNPDGSLDFECNNGGSPAAFGSIADGHWHHIALTYDQSVGALQIIYIDGVRIAPAANAVAWSWNVGQDLDLGLSSDTADWQPYNGSLDDVRVYSRTLSDAEVTSAYAGALVDPSTLMLRMNFDAPPTSGVTLRWRCPDAILQVAPVVNGTYTDLPSAGPPYAVSAKAAASFFRYRGHTPTNIVSNPYLM